MSKKSFYCWYLGFTEAYGQQGQNRVYELLKNLTNHQINPNEGIPPSKVTLHLSETCMTLIDNSQVAPVNSKKQRNKSTDPPKTQKSYSIGYENITFVGRLADRQYSDILTCIVRNQSLTTRETAFYLHGFRCDSQETAKKMEQYLNYFRKIFFKKFDKQMQKQKEVFKKQNKVFLESPRQDLIPTYEPSKNSNLKENFIRRQIFKITDHFNQTNSSGGTRSSTSQNEIYYQGQHVNTVSYQPKNNDIKNQVLPNKPKIYEDIHTEIAAKIEKGEVFLFPPKDYSDVMREKRGNLKERDNRRCLNEKIVGEIAIKTAKAETNNELYLNLSSRSYKNETEINTARTDKTADLNSLSFNEQATQVLNYFDQIVDSVDATYKTPIESSHSVNKYEPPKDGLPIDNNGYTPRKQPKKQQQYEPDYEPYEPLTDNYQALKFQNNKAAIENSLINKKTALESNFLKKNKNIKDLIKLKNQTSVNEDLYAANVGVRTNALPVLGNYKPKMYGNIPEESNQIIYRPLGNSNKENVFKNQQRNFSASDESVYKKMKYPIHAENMYNSNNQVYDPNSNLGMKSLSNEMIERNEKQRQTAQYNNSNFYVSQSNYNSQFILKPAVEESINYRNIVHVEDPHKYKSARQAPSAVIDIYGSPQLNRNAISGSYPINDIYY